MGRDPAIPLGRDRGLAGRFQPNNNFIRKSAFARTWDDQAAAFESSDEMLNRIWDLFRYSINAAEYSAMAATAHASFQLLLFDRTRRAYRDGVGTDHSSQHASLFPLAFGLVPAEYFPAVVDAVKKRGMACSVYAAQYLMEGLFAHEAGTRALELITAPTDRSWRHMVESGATITWEAWDMRHKPNQDWNHAWGAAPANLFPRYILGAGAVSPGWKQARIRPNTGTLSFAKGKTPPHSDRSKWAGKTSHSSRCASSSKPA